MEQGVACAFRNGKALTVQMLADALDDDNDKNQPRFLHPPSAGCSDDMWYKIRTVLLK